MLCLQRPWQGSHDRISGPADAPMLSESQPEESRGRRRRLRAAPCRLRALIANRAAPGLRCFGIRLQGGGATVFADM